METGPSSIPPDSQWVVIELTPEGEELSQHGKLEARIKKDLAPLKPHIILPRQGGRSPLSYLFIENTLPSAKYFGLERKSYVEQVLSRSIGTLRVLKLVKGVEIQTLQGSLDRPTGPQYVRGQPVEITGGPFTRVRGRYVGPFGPQEVLVQVQTKTLLRIITVPRMDITPSDDKTLPPLFYPPVSYKKKHRSPKAVSGPGKVSQIQLAMF